MHSIHVHTFLVHPSEDPFNKNLIKDHKCGHLAVWPVWPRTGIVFVLEYEPFLVVVQFNLTGGKRWQEHAAWLTSPTTSIAMCRAGDVMLFWGGNFLGVDWKLVKLEMPGKMIRTYILSKR